MLVLGITLFISVVICYECKLFDLRTIKKQLSEENYLLNKENEKLKKIISERY